MTMVERVARAIAQTKYNSSLMEMDKYIDSTWPVFVYEARAAIAAIRKPTEDMLEAGSPWRNPAGAAATWQAMIDAALEEK